MLSDKFVLLIGYLLLLENGHGT